MAKKTKNIPPASSYTYIDEDKDGNKWYPHTLAKVVTLDDGTPLTTEMKRIEASIEASVGGIDLSSVNTHTTAKIEEVKVKIEEVKTKVDGVNTNTNSQHTTTKAHVTTEKNNTVSAVNSARDNINNYTLARKNEVINAINANSNQRATPSTNWKLSFSKSIVLNNALNPRNYSGVYVGFIYLKSGDGFKIKTNAIPLTIEVPNASGSGDVEMVVSVLPSYSYGNPYAIGTVVDYVTNKAIIGKIFSEVKGITTVGTTNITLPASEFNFSLTNASGEYIVFVTFNGRRYNSDIRIIGNPTISLYVGCN